MNVYTAMIMEDETSSLELLDMLLQPFTNVDVVYRAQTVADAIYGANTHKPDIMFCDVELPDGTCFDMFKSIDVPSKAVCIVTSYKDYAIHAIKHGVVDFILKPIDHAELEQALDRITQHLNADPPATPLSSVNNILINDFRGCKILNEEDIIYVHADGQYCNIHMTDKKAVLTSYNLAHFEKELSTDFFRVHKSYVINKTKVISIDQGRGGRVRLATGAAVPIAYRRKVELRSAIRMME